MPSIGADQEGTSIRTRPVLSIATVSVLLMALGACSSPAARFDRAAAAGGLAKRSVEGEGFWHAVFARPAAVNDGTLRIYLDGDGAPYWGNAIAPDPTPGKSLELRLLEEDSGPALLLGRPCHHGERGTTGRCTSDLWTTARYGNRVVASMITAARRVIAAAGARSVTLIGHSGGGALAMLMAPALPEVRTVVTIGADLDVAGWSAYVGEDLSGSLDPATRPPLRPEIVQRHYAGSADVIVPPLVAAPGLKGGARLTVVEGYDHRCCWTDIWPDILREITPPQDQSATRTPIVPP